MLIEYRSGLISLLSLDARRAFTGPCQTTHGAFFSSAPGRALSKLISPPANDDFVRVGHTVILPWEPVMAANGDASAYLPISRTLRSARYPPRNGDLVRSGKGSGLPVEYPIGVAS